jgi:uroporphyrin-III C-methyltransferase/precorrin-2 dehydrogenase/sirohydrochlorin ferrochelatase
VILFDEWVSMEILDFARREAKKLLVGKAGDDVTDLMVGLAKAGRRVVRLSGADVVDNTGDVLTRCRKAGIAIEVVPGVTSAVLKETPQAGNAETRVA